MYGARQSVRSSLCNRGRVNVNFFLRNQRPEGRQYTELRLIRVFRLADLRSHRSHHRIVLTKSAHKEVQCDVTGLGRNYVFETKAADGTCGVLCLLTYTHSSATRKHKARDAARTPERRRDPCPNEGATAPIRGRNPWFSSTGTATLKYRDTTVYHNSAGASLPSFRRHDRVSATNIPVVV